MAHPYSTEARLKRYLAGKGERYLALLDRNYDGIADADAVQSVVDDVLERVANDIDAELGAIYSVPFGAVTPTLPATATTYGQVADLCDIGASALLWSWADPECSDAVSAQATYDSALDGYRDGSRVIPGAGRVTVGTGRRSFAWESAGHEFAGGVTSGDRTIPYTTDTTDPTRLL